MHQSHLSTGILTLIAVTVALTACHTPASTPVADEGETQQAAALSATTTPTTEATAAPTAPQPLTPEQLRNASYQLDDLGTIQLSDGEYQDQYGDGATMVNTVGLDSIALGDINGDGLGDATAILWLNTGGTGVWSYMVALVNDAGLARQVARVNLGDRSVVKEMTIDSDLVTLTMMVHGPDDPLCCPNSRAVRIYQLTEDRFEMVDETITELPAPLTYDEIANAQYELPELGAIQLENGEYRNQYGDGASMVDTVGITDVAMGDLNGDLVDDAAIVLWHSGGGTGTWIYLIAMLNSEDGPQQAGVIPLGDRTYLNRLGIRDGAVELDLLAHGPDDAACCPTVRAIQSYRFNAGTLDLTTETLTPAALLPDQVSFVNTLDTEVSYGQLMTAAPFDPMMPPGMNGMPMHVAYFFDYNGPSEWLDPRQMQLRVFPLAEYAALYEGSNVEGWIEGEVATLRDIIEAAPEIPEDSIPLLPAQAAVQVFHAGVRYLDFQGGSGVRFVTYYAQDVSPIVGERIFYTFQGLTNDDRFWISFFAPIDTDVLPSTYDDLPADFDYDAFAAEYESYIADTITALGNTNYAPDLAALDAMIQSLEITTP